MNVIKLLPCWPRSWNMLGYLLPIIVATSLITPTSRKATLKIQKKIKWAKANMPDVRYWISVNKLSQITEELELFALFLYQKFPVPIQNILSLLQHQLSNLSNLFQLLFPDLLYGHGIQATVLVILIQHLFLVLLNTTYAYNIFLLLLYLLQFLNLCSLGEPTSSSVRIPHCHCAGGYPARLL